MKKIIVFVVLILFSPSSSSQSPLWIYNYGVQNQQSSSAPSNVSDSSNPILNSPNLVNDNPRPLDSNSLTDETKRLIEDNLKIQEDINNQKIDPAENFISDENGPEEYINNNKIPLGNYKLTEYDKAKLLTQMKVMALRGNYPNKSRIERFAIITYIERLSNNLNYDSIKYLEYAESLMHSSVNYAMDEKLGSSNVMLDLAEQVIRIGKSNDKTHYIYPYLNSLSSIPADKKLRNTELNKLYRIINALPDNASTYAFDSDIKSVAMSYLSKADTEFDPDKRQWLANVAASTIEILIGLHPLSSLAQSVYEICASKNIFGNPLTELDYLNHSVNIITVGMSSVSTSIFTKAVKNAPELLKITKSEGLARIISKSADDTYAVIQSYKDGFDSMVIQNLSRMSEIKLKKINELNLDIFKNAKGVSGINAVINNKNTKTESISLGMASKRQSSAFASMFLNRDINKMGNRKIYRNELNYLDGYQETIIGSSGFVGEVMQYRPPTYKPQLKVMQSNFEWKLIYKASDGKIKELNLLNAHLIIK